MKRWDSKDEEFLKNNLNLSNKELANKLNKTEASIINKKKKMKLTKPIDEYKFQNGEVFNAIEETDGRYLVSNFGNVINAKNKRLMKPTLNEDGYPNLRLYIGRNKNGEDTYHSETVHRLVAKNFVAKDDESYNTVNHIDGNKTNNHYTNLEWCDQQYNVDHAIENNLSDPQANASKLTKEQVIEVCKLLSEKKYTQKEIAEKFNVKKDVIGGIKRGKHWTNISKDYIDKF